MRSNNRWPSVTSFRGKGYTLTNSSDESTEILTQEVIEKFFPKDTWADKLFRREINTRFSTFMACVILLNCLEIGAECQWTRDQPMMAEIYMCLDVALFCCYVIEIIIKWRMFGIEYYFCEPLDRAWNILDFTLTVLMAIEFLTEFLCKDPHLHRVTSQLFLLRFARLFRILRILRKVPELSLLLEGLISSWSRLGWIVSLLMLLIYIFGIFFTIEADSSIFDQGYFDDLASSMSTLLNIIIGAEWMAIASPILERQPLLMMPLLLFLVVGSFGILNCVVGVIVDATAESKGHFVFSKKLEQLRDLSKMWLDKTNTVGLQQEEISAERKAKIIEILDEIIRSETVAFPAGTTPQELYDIIDEDGSGDVTHEEFVVGMGQLLLADPFQLSCQQSVSLAKLRHMAFRAEGKVQELQWGLESLQVKMNQSVSRIEAQLEKMAK